MNRILDIYVKSSIRWDLILVCSIWLFDEFIDAIPYNYLSKTDQIALLSSIIGTCVSLSGFILAALTIIVTFKSNIKAKSMDDATDALDLIFSSKHYTPIINVFKSAILEYCIIFVVLYFAWISAANLDLIAINRVNFCAILVSSLIAFRSLKVLFGVIDLSGKVKKNSEGVI